MRHQALTAAALALLATSVLAEPAELPDPDALDRESVIDLVFGKTAECRKEKDQSLCANYFSDEGRIVQLLREDNERKSGVWFVDDQDRLCILWTGRLKPLCFTVIPQDDGSYNLFKHDKHITTILSIEDGNPQGL